MNKGITLIETILYLTLLSAFVVIAIPALINLQAWRTAQINSANVIEEFVFVNKKIKNILNEAESIQIPRPGDFSDVLTVALPGGDTVTVMSVDHVVVVRENDETPTALYSGEVVQMDFTFFRPISSNLPLLMSNGVINGFNFGTSTHAFKNE